MRFFIHAFRLFAIFTFLYAAGCDGGGSGGGNGGNGGNGGADITGDSTPPINIVGMVRSNMANDVMAVVSIYDVSADHQQTAATVVDDLTVTVNEVALTCTDTGSAGYKYINNNLQLNPTADLALGYKGGNTYTLKVTGTPTLADGLTYDVDVTATVTVPTTAAAGFTFKNDWFRYAPSQSFQYTAGDAAKVDVTVNVLDASANVLQCYNHVAANVSPYTLGATDAYAYAVGGVDATQMQIRVNSYNETLIPDYDYMTPAPVSETQIASKFVALPELAGSGYEGEATIPVLNKIPIHIKAFVANNGASDTASWVMIFDTSTTNNETYGNDIRDLSVTVNGKVVPTAPGVMEDVHGVWYYSDNLQLNEGADPSAGYKAGTIYTLRVTGTKTLLDGHTYDVDATASVTPPSTLASGFHFETSWDMSVPSHQFSIDSLGDGEKLGITIQLLYGAGGDFLKSYSLRLDNVSPVTITGTDQWLYTNGTQTASQISLMCNSFNETSIPGYDYIYTMPAVETSTFGTDYQEESVFLAYPELVIFTYEGTTTIPAVP